jgi:amino acid transporter
MAGDGAMSSDLLDRTDDGLVKSMGYKETLHRGFTGAFMNFAFTMTTVGCLTSLSTSWGASMSNGGPTTIIYGWIVCAIFNSISGLAMAEICAVYPCAGAVYHWAAFLAPRKHSNVWAYICGMFNLLGNTAGDAIFALGLASFVSGCLQFRDGAQAGLEAEGLTDYQQIGVAIGFCFLWAVLNIARIDQVGWVNNFAAVFQCVTTLVIIGFIVGYMHTYMFIYISISICIYL